MNYWVDSASDEAEALCLSYHYSHRLPSNVQLIVTAHDDGGLFGDRGDCRAAVFFSIPPTRWAEEVWELSRLIRDETAAIQLTSLIAYACNIIRKRKAMDLLVSFADWTERHHGGIYQAASWNFDGLRAPQMTGVEISGAFVPGRSCNSKYGTRSPERLAERGIIATASYDEGKYLYWRSLSKHGDRKAARLGLKTLPYPKPSTAT